MEVKYERE
jgi:vacuolar-type H+-ATPase subunit E/Vma4